MVALESVYEKITENKSDRYLVNSCICHNVKIISAWKCTNKQSKRQRYLVETIANNKSGVTARNIRMIFHQELEVSYCCPNCNKKVRQQTDQLNKKV